jgi:hypothetical protein
MSIAASLLFALLQSTGSDVENPGVVSLAVMATVVVDT